jgi:hypothetical protein
MKLVGTTNIHLIFFAENNDFAPAFKRVNRRVLVDSRVFWQIVEQKNVKGR